MQSSNCRVCVKMEESEQLLFNTAAVRTMHYSEEWKLFKSDEE